MKKYIAAIGATVILVGTLLPVYFAAAAASDSTWISGVNPIVIKTGDLPNNQVPFSAGRDCGNICYGEVSAGQYLNNTFNDGKNGWGTLLWYYLFPSPSSKVTFATTDMTKFRIYTDILESDVSYTPTYNYGKQYTLRRAPEGKFISERTGQEMTNVGVTDAAFSNNGKWMVMHVTDPYSSQGSLAIFDTTTFRGKVIGPNSVGTYYWGNGGNNTPGAGNLAVSDDGRYVADSFTQQTPSIGNKEYGVRIYDTTTCTDQYGISGTRANCIYKNAWSGKVNGTVQNSGGIAEQLGGSPERPLNVRFKDNETITFSTIHDYVSSTNFKASTYEASLLKKPDPIKLLAMGDSYISGEGAYSYREGTDTSNNKCHQSTVSYPYLLGASFASDYHSVACSGAVIANITEPDYPNQLKDPVAQNSYDNIQINEIMQSGKVGMIEQLKYVANLKPNAILLSIGGNDIGFADVVKRCVLSFAWDPCYHKQSERKSLLLTIYSKFKMLKTTYAKILSEAPQGARLYVMGYPQVVNPTGNCGVNVHLDDSERQFASLLIDRLNETVQMAAESSGAVYVDVSDTLVGHRLCDTHDDGVNGLTSGDDKLSIGIFLGTKSHSFGLGNESYHPTALGHQLISNVVAQKTENLRKQSVGAANILLPKITDDDAFITTGAVDDAKARKIERQDVVNTNVVTAGQSVKLDIDTNEANLRAGSTYQVVFHSEEVSVASGVVSRPDRLQLDIVVPKLSPGIHSVHIYGTDVDGEGVDITEDIYIVASNNDFDGDGIKNDEDSMLFINETGKVIIENTNSDVSSDKPQTKDDQTKMQNLENLQTNITTTPKSADTDKVVTTITSIENGQTSDIPPVVLGASDFRALPDGVNGGDSKRQVKEHRGKTGLYITLGVAGVIVIGWIYKRSKRQSATL